MPNNNTPNNSVEVLPVQGSATDNAKCKIIAVGFSAAALIAAGAYCYNKNDGNQENNKSTKDVIVKGPSQIDGSSPKSFLKPKQDIEGSQIYKASNESNNEISDPKQVSQEVLANQGNANFANSKTKVSSSTSFVETSVKNEIEKYASKSVPVNKSVVKSEESKTSDVKKGSANKSNSNNKSTGEFQTHQSSEKKLNVLSSNVANLAATTNGSKTQTGNINGPTSKKAVSTVSSVKQLSKKGPRYMNPIGKLKKTQSPKKKTVAYPQDLQPNNASLLKLVHTEEEKARWEDYDQRRNEEKQRANQEIQAEIKEKKAVVSAAKAAKKAAARPRDPAAQKKSEEVTTEQRRREKEAKEAKKKAEVALKATAVKKSKDLAIKKKGEKRKAAEEAAKEAARKRVLALEKRQAEKILAEHNMKEKQRLVLQMKNKRDGARKKKKPDQGRENKVKK